MTKSPNYKRADRNTRRNLRKVTAELAKTRRAAKKAEREAAAFVQMAMAAKKVFEKKLKIALKTSLVLFVGALFLGRATSDEKMPASVLNLGTYGAEKLLCRIFFDSARKC